MLASQSSHGQVNVVYILACESKENLFTKQQEKERIEKNLIWFLFSIKEAVVWIVQSSFACANLTIQIRF